MDRAFRIVVIVVLLIIHVLILLHMNKKNKCVTTFSAVITASILYYCIIPLIVFFFSEVPVNKTLKRIFESTLLQFLSAELGIILFVVSFYIVYTKYNTIKFEKAYSINYLKMNKILKWMSIITFGVGSVSFIFYIKAFGGIKELLAYANYLRSFSASATSIISYESSLLVIPSKLITVTPLLIIPVIKQESNTKVRSFLISVLVISLLMAILFYLSNAGKTAIIVFGICFAVPIFRKYIKHPWRLVFVSAIIGLPILGVLDGLFVYMQKGVWPEIELNILAYLPAFGHPYKNILNMANIAKSFGFRWGQDFITGILDIIPGLNFQASYEVTSEFMSGENWRVLGGTPNDIITFGFLQIGYLGIVLMGSLLGWICGLIDNIIKRSFSNKGYSVLITSIIANMFCFIVNADIQTLVRSQFQLTIAIICVLYSYDRKKRRIKYNK